MDKPKLNWNIISEVLDAAVEDALDRACITSDIMRIRCLDTATETFMTAIQDYYEITKSEDYCYIEENGECSSEDPRCIHQPVKAKTAKDAAYDEGYKKGWKGGVVEGYMMARKELDGTPRK